MTLFLPVQTFGDGPGRKGPKGLSQVAGRSSDGSANRGNPERRAPADGSDEPDGRKMPDRLLAGRVVLVAVRRPGQTFGSAGRLVRFFGTGGSKGTTLGKVPVRNGSLRADVSGKASGRVLRGMMQTPRLGT